MLVKFRELATLKEHGTKIAVVSDIHIAARHPLDIQGTAPFIDEPDCVLVGSSRCGQHVRLHGIGRTCSVRFVGSYPMRVARQRSRDLQRGRSSNRDGSVARGPHSETRRTLRIRE